MKLKFKGIFKSYDELPKGNLPANAVKFKEVKGFLMLNLISFLITVPVCLALRETARLRMDNATQLRPMLLWGLLSAAVCIVPHEIIHGLAMGGEEAFIYFSPKNLLAFCIAFSPMSKTRFFIMGIAPSFILGWLPFTAAMIFPNLAVSGFLAMAGIINILTGVGDWIKIFLAAVQVPKGCLIQFSGIDLYWFKPNEAYFNANLAQ